MVGLTKTAALDYALSGIRVNAICPGVIATPMVDRALGSSAEADATIAQMEPMGRPVFLKRSLRRRSGSARRRRVRDRADDHRRRRIRRPVTRMLQAVRVRARTACVIPPPGTRFGRSGALR
ncbi:MAG: SDR family oxidoreductase [Thermomicrobiales bacterium]